MEAANGNGSVFRLEPDGDNFLVLHAFSGTDGDDPYAGVILGGGFLFGTASAGGNDGRGRRLQGGHERKQFRGDPPLRRRQRRQQSPSATSCRDRTRSSTALRAITAPTGSGPSSASIREGRTLRSSIRSARSLPTARIPTEASSSHPTESSTGRPTELTTEPAPGRSSGSILTGPTSRLFTSSRADQRRPGSGCFSWWRCPTASCTAQRPSTACAGSGTVYKLRRDGTDYDVVHAFSGAEGGNPRASLIRIVGGLLYGTATTGGTGGGTVYRMTVAGQLVDSAHDFIDGSGDAPHGAVLQGLDGALYGTASSGGANNIGAIWRLTTPSVLSITPDSGPAAGGTDVTITGTGFANQATVSLSGSMTTSVQIEDPNTITATTPNLAPGQLHDLAVVNTDASIGFLERARLADFLDVPRGDIFHDFVEAIVARRDHGRLRRRQLLPRASVTRAQMAVFLLKAKHGVGLCAPACTGPSSPTCRARRCSPTGSSSSRGGHHRRLRRRQLLSRRRGHARPDGRLPAEGRARCRPTPRRPAAGSSRTCPARPSSPTGSSSSSPRTSRRAAAAATIARASPTRAARWRYS